MGSSAGTKTVGILGGMGPLATNAFFSALLEATEAERDQDHVHILIDSDPTIPDRTDYLLRDGEDPRPAMVRAAQRLAAGGSDLLVMPCNTAHVFLRDVQSQTSVPFLDWIKVAVEAVLRHDPRTVGILGTSATVALGVYPPAFARFGVETITPDVPDQAAVQQIIRAIKMSTATEGDRAELFRVGARLVDQGADVLLLACTELPILVSAADHGWPCPTVDPAAAVARAVVALAGGRVKGPT